MLGMPVGLSEQRFRRCNHNRSPACNSGHRYRSLASSTETEAFHTPEWV